MHYSSYSHVCHFLLQDPSSHCMEYYPLVSSDSSINHDFVLFVEPGTLRERCSSHAAHIPVQRETKDPLLFSDFAITQGTGYWRLTKQCRQYICTASVDQAVVPRPPQSSSGAVMYWCCLCLRATREEALSKTSALLSWKPISSLHSAATRSLSANTIAL